MTIVCTSCKKEQLEDGPRFPRCSRCASERLADGAHYCSKQCQKNDWPKHKQWHEGMAQLLAIAEPASSESKVEAYGELLKRGLREIAAGDHAAGVASFKQCIWLHPEQPAAHANLGMALRDRGDFTAALPSLLRAVELYDEDSEQWATTAAVSWFAFASGGGGGGGGGEQAGPAWLTSLEARIAVAERCVLAADGSMQCWAMLGMALAEQGLDLGRAARAFMKASSLTDQPQTRDGYRKFAHELLQRLKEGAPAATASATEAATATAE